MNVKYQLGWFRMSWLPEFVQKNLKQLRCFICETKLTDVTAEVNYSYIDNGVPTLGKVMICSKCADKLDTNSVESEYDQSL